MSIKNYFVYAHGAVNNNGSFFVPANFSIEFFYNPAEENVIIFSHPGDAQTICNKGIIPPIHYNQENRCRDMYLYPAEQSEAWTAGIYDCNSRGIVRLQQRTTLRELVNYMETNDYAMLDPVNIIVVACGTPYGANVNSDRINMVYPAYTNGDNHPIIVHKWSGYLNSLPPFAVVESNYYYHQGLAKFNHNRMAAVIYASYIQDGVPADIAENTANYLLTRDISLPRDGWWNGRSRAGLRKTYRKNGRKRRNTRKHT